MWGPRVTSHGIPTDPFRAVLRDFLDRRAPLSNALTDTERTHRFDLEFHPGALLVPEEFGGDGAALADAVTLVAEAARALLDGSALAGMLAADTLTTLPSGHDRDELLGAIASSRAQVATPVWLSGGPNDHLVLGVEHATHALAFADARVLVVGLDDVPPTRLGGIDPTRALGRLATAEGAVLAEGEAAHAARGRYTTTALVLLAAELGAIADKCIEMTVEYARTRQQFGVPIATFQAVKHVCATMAVDAAEGHALVDVAVQSAATDEPDAPARAAAAKALMSEACGRVARSAIEVHGGVGFAWEYPAQLYFKRAAADAAMFGTPDQQYLTLSSVLPIYAYDSSDFVDGAPGPGSSR